MDDNNEAKKAKGSKKCVIKRKIMFENYTDCPFNDKIILKSQERFISYLHNMHTEEVNKISISSNDDKRLQTFDKVTTYPYGANAFRVYERIQLNRIQSGHIFQITYTEYYNRLFRIWKNKRIIKFNKPTTRH